MNTFLWGALAMSSAVAGLFFLKFWKESRDRLFVFFVLAFWAMALNWALLALVQQPTETRHWVYMLRLFAFVLIIVGIIDKNRRA
jgi:hypothetical protein